MAIVIQEGLYQQEFRLLVKGFKEQNPEHKGGSSKESRALPSILASSLALSLVLEAHPWGGLCAALSSKQAGKLF